jgi:hypothetical protein
MPSVDIDAMPPQATYLSSPYDRTRRYDHITVAVGLEVGNLNTYRKLRRRPVVTVVGTVPAPGYTRYCCSDSFRRVAGGEPVRSLGMVPSGVRRPIQSMTVVGLRPRQLHKLLKY